MSQFLFEPLASAIGWFYVSSPRWMRNASVTGLAAILQLAGLRKKVVFENLQHAFPEDAAQRKRLEGEAYRHLAALTFEILQLFAPRKALRKWVLKNVDFLGAENWKAAHERGKGVLFLSSHVGNWEIMSAGGALFTPMDLMIVTKRLKPAWFHDRMESGRRSCGFGATYEPRTLKDVLSHLKKGGTVGFVLDQYTGAPVGVRVPVFGIPVGTSAALATLARRTGAPVLPVVNYRLPNGRHIVDVRPALEWIQDESPERELALNTARYAQVVEKDIYAHPEQWLWIHRRFKGDLSPLRPEEWEGGRARH